MVLRLICMFVLWPQRFRTEFSEGKITGRVSPTFVIKSRLFLSPKLSFLIEMSSRARHTALQLLQAPLERLKEACESRGDARWHRPDRPAHQPGGVFLRLSERGGFCGGLWLPGRLLHPVRRLQQTGASPWSVHAHSDFPVCIAILIPPFCAPSAFVCLRASGWDHPQLHWACGELHRHHAAAAEGGADLWELHVWQAGEIQFRREHHVTGWVRGAENYSSTPGEITALLFLSIFGEYTGTPVSVSDQRPSNKNICFRVEAKVKLN